MSLVHEPLTVFLVEDTADDEQLALRALRGSGLPLLVKVARDGERALDLLGLEGHSSTRPMPKLVLCDLKLPKVSGHEVLAKIRKNPATADVPVVMFSSSDEPRDLERSYQLGASSYVRKPVDYGEYLDRVQEVTRYWLTAETPDSSLPHYDFEELPVETGSR